MGILHWLGRVIKMANGLKMSQDHPLSSHWPTTINSLSKINNKQPFNVINQLDHYLEMDLIYLFVTKKTKSIHSQISTSVTLILITNGMTNNQNKNSVGIQIWNLMILIINCLCCNGKCTQWNWCEEWLKIKGE